MGRILVMEKEGHFHFHISSESGLGFSCAGQAPTCSPQVVLSDK